jgi:hypothetical protein
MHSLIPPVSGLDTRSKLAMVITIMAVLAAFGFTLAAYI